MSCPLCGHYRNLHIGEAKTVDENLRVEFHCKNCDGTAALEFAKESKPGTLGDVLTATWIPIVWPEAEVEDDIEGVDVSSPAVFALMTK
jgi:hypothetical protein